MFVISKLFTAFFLLPGILVPLLFYLGWKNAGARKTLWLLALLWYILTITATSLTPLNWLENSFRTPPKSPPIAVVVLGGGVGVGHPNLPLSSDGLKRALAGVNYAKKHNLPLFYSGGGSKGLTEADAFTKSLNYIYSQFDINLPLANPNKLDGFGLALEDKSRDTFENGRYISSLLPSKSTIALVSSAYHLPRAKLIFEYFGFEVLLISTDYKRDYPTHLDWRDWIPSMDGLQKNYIILHEIVGIISLTLRGVFPI